MVGSYLRLFWKFFILNLKAAVEFRLEFIIRTLLIVLNNLVLVGSVYLIVSSQYIGVSPKEFLMMASIVQGAYVIGVALFQNLRRLNEIIIKGDLDSLLIRPKSPYFTLLISKIDLYFIGELLTFIFYFLISPHKLFQIPWIICGGILYHCVMLLIETLPFFIRLNYPHGILNVFYTFATYPPTIYHDFLKKIALYIIPGAMIGYGPILIMKKLEFIITYFAVLLTFVFLAIICWKVGLKRYESVGY